jgi:hypothetical protein
MSSITVRFRCGHAFALDASVNGHPTCPTCGETQVSRTTAPAPRFTGFCQGPSAESKRLDAIPIAIPKEP